MGFLEKPASSCPPAALAVPGMVPGTARPVLGSCCVVERKQNGFPVNYYPTETRFLKPVFFTEVNDSTVYCISNENWVIVLCFSNVFGAVDTRFCPKHFVDIEVTD